MKPKLSPPESLRSRDFVTPFLNLRLVSFVVYRMSFFVCLLTLSPAPRALSQVPQGFNYQAVARDAVSGNPVTDPVDVRIAILADDAPEDVLWEEQHTGVDPDDHGLFSIVVGGGVYESGPVLTFDAIDWTVTPRYIRTMIYYGGTWKNMGSAQLWSVPYAMVADSLGGPLKKLEVEGETEDMEESLFEVRNKEGHIVFAVYNEGVRIYVSDGDAKGPKGGFAIGGFGLVKQDDQHYFFVSGDSIRAYIDSTSVKGVKGGFAIGGFDYTKGKPQDYMKVTRDSVRIYLDANPATKGPKGGFAIGGFDYTKAEEEEYLRVTRDSTRVYVNEDQAKGVKGGFAIGGFGTVKGSPTPFTSLTPENYFIGHEGGQKLTDGVFNSTLGYQSGRNITSGDSNAFIGYQSGFNNSTGTGNLFLGYQTGFSTTGGSYNSFVGHKSGYSNTTGVNNSFIGSYAGYSNTTGKYNTFVGDSAGLKNTTGNENSFYGDKAGFKNIGASNNVFIGNLAGYNNTGGDSLIFIGNRAGHSNTTGQTNVFIGNRAGYFNTTGKENVFIGTSAGKGSSTGSTASGNIVLGHYAGKSLLTSENNVLIGGGSGNKTTTGFWNVFLGMYSGYSNIGGHANVYLGWSAGHDNTSGFGNVFIGYQAGRNELGTMKLYIESSPADENSALIYGDFYNDLLRFNGNVSIGAPPNAAKLNISASGDGAAVLNLSIDRSWIFEQEGTEQFTALRLRSYSGKVFNIDTGGATRFRSSDGNYTYVTITNFENEGRVGIGDSSPNAALDVVGDIDYTGTLTHVSDITLKKDIVQLSDVLKKIMNIRGVEYSFIDTAKYGSERQTGLIAQEVQKEFPNLVNEMDPGILGVNSVDFNAVLLEAIKEQQAQIEAMKAEIEELRKR